VCFAIQLPGTVEVPHVWRRPLEPLPLVAPLPPTPTLHQDFARYRTSALESKTANSYFLSMPARKTSFHAASGDLFASPTVAASAPPGFRYAPNLFSPAAERGFVEQFETLPFKPFDFHGYQGNRRIVSFGYRYDYSARTLRSSDAMPEFLHALREIASGFSGIPSQALEQALVTEYAPGAGIGWHRDKPMFEDVVALSFLAPCALRLRRKDGVGWQRRAVQVAPRSGYLLHDAVRTEWEHSITPMEALRYSVTFRSFRADSSVRLS
jgi:alkylated DNA repair dioxygenase AlkB